MGTVANKYTVDFSIYEKRRLKGQYLLSVVDTELSMPLVLWPVDGDPFYFKEKAACLIEFDGYIYIHPNDLSLLQTTFVLAQISKKYEKFNVVLFSFN